MSTLSRAFASVAESFAAAYDLLLPSYCIVCNRRKADRTNPLCPACHCDAPLTHFAHIPENPMMQHATAKIEGVVHASALFHYSRDDAWRQMIHRLKYRGRHRLGTTMGQMLGRDLTRSPLYADIDLIIAVPLHPLRQIYRGYNQSHYIARAVARELHRPFRKDLLRRTRYNTSQVKTERSMRWDNVRDLFQVTDAKAFANRSVLIIDDVFTTGATTLSCAKSILSAEPSCRIYIATIAVSGSRFDA